MSELFNEGNLNQIIEEVVDECRYENGIVNLIIRDDVFKILERNCIVVYYPLKEEDINGFHVERHINGERKHFVYLNTWNTTERQIFTAAHELGHIWGVYGKVKEKNPKIDEYITSVSGISPEEYIVGKFAAQLLMPESLFVKEMNAFLTSLNYNGKSISAINLLRLIASLMNVFFVGYKATTLRLLEIGKLSPPVYDYIMRYEHTGLFKQILKEGDYKRLNQRLENRNIVNASNASISNIFELINNAERSDCALYNTVEFFKNEFDISSPNLNDVDNEVDF